MENVSAISPVTQYMACLIEQGKYTEAGALAKKYCNMKGGDSLRYYMGIAFLKQDKVDEAIAEFQAVLRSSPDDNIKKLMTELFIHQLDHKLALGDYDGFSKYLEQVLSISGETGEVKKRLEKYSDYLPALYLKINKRGEAAKIWEESFRKDHSIKVAHSLAILYYWWAKDLEEKKDIGADDAWKKAIMYMVALKYAKDYWALWKKKKEEACSRPDDGFAIEDPAITDFVDNKYLGKLEKDLNVYLEKYDGDSLNQSRINNLVSALKLEIKSAAYYKKALDATGMGIQDKVKFYPVCGSMLINELGMAGNINGLIDSIPSYNVDDNVVRGLKDHFSPIGHVLVLIENKRFTEAENALRSLSYDVTQSEGGVNAKVTLYLEWGREEILINNSFYGALSKWKDAVSAASWYTSYGYYSKKSAVTERIAAILKEGAFDKRGENDLDNIITLYEGVVEICSDIGKDTRTFLANKQVDKGVKQWDAKLFDNALNYFKKAYDNDPDNLRAKEMIATYYNNKGVEIMDRDGSMDQAISMFEDARRYNDNEGIRRNMAIAYGNKGIQILNKADSGMKYNPRYYSSEVDSAIDCLDKSLKLSYNESIQKALGYGYFLKAIIAANGYNRYEAQRYAYMAVRYDPSLTDAARRNGLI